MGALCLLCEWCTSLIDPPGDQRREKPRVVQTGPYAWVRHPLYRYAHYPISTTSRLMRCSLAVFQTALWSLMFWSYVPLFMIFATVAVFGYKISLEVLPILGLGNIYSWIVVCQEEVIQRDDGIREEYRAYMRKVPARLVPYVW